MKFALFGAVFGAIGSFTTTAGDIAMLAAGAAGIGYILRHILIPVVQIVRKAASATDAIYELPSTIKGIDVRFQGIEHTLEEHGEALAGLTRELDIPTRSVDPLTPDV